MEKIKTLNSYSISTHIRTYFFATEAETGSYFKGTTLIARYRGSSLQGALCRPFRVLKKMFCPIICSGKVFMDLIIVEENQTLTPK